jgi:orotate phosphoribosyltransferase-like protein
MDLSSKGMNQDQIAIELQVSQGTVSDDLTNLKAEAQTHLEKHVTETLPHEYQKCMIGINQVVNMAWSIVSKSPDDKTKLQALTLISDCNKYKMDLTTNGSLIMDSVKIVEDRLNHLNKEQEPTETEIEEADGIF